MAMMELENPRHFKPSRLNLSTIQDYYDFRAVLNINVYKWLVQHHLPHSITITHCEWSNPDLPRWSNVWLTEFEREVRAFIEFDDPGHLLLFKLTWG